MKKNFTQWLLVIALSFFAISVQAQLDVTNLLLTNAGFDEQWNYKATDEPENLGSANAGANIKPVYGWNIVSTGDNSAAASYEYGYTGWLNSQDLGYGTVPATGYNGSTGGALGISSAWLATNAYGQNVTLPAGSYSMEYVAYNSGPTDVDNSQVGWVPDSGDAILSSKTTFTLSDWDSETIPLELSATTSGKIQVGINAPNSGSGAVGRIFFDYIKLTCHFIDKTVLQALVDEANALYGNGTGTKAPELRVALDAYNAVSGDAGTSPALIIAAINLGKAVQAYKDCVADELFLANALIELEELLDRAEELISSHNSNVYSQAALQALETAFEDALNAYDAGTLTAANIQGFIDRLLSAIENYRASASGLKIQYTFDNVTGNVVANAAGEEYNGTLNNEASVISMGKYKVLSLGNGTGYLDMGQSAGNIFPTMNNYTVSAYYRVDKNASLSGNGYFLWAFSVLAANAQTSGPYVAYRLNVQRFALSTGGWSGETGIEVGAEATKDVWQHVLYRQTGNVGELYIGGQLVGTIDAVPIPSAAFTTPPPYNWIGRAPFSGDSYLKNTLVYDFRLYNQAVETDQIAEWSALVPDLNNEYDYGTKGDFSKLIALIAEYNTILANVTIGEGVGEYPQTAIWELEDAIAIAQEFVNGNKGSQFLVDTHIADLKAAYDKFLSSAGFTMVHPASAGETQYPFESGLYYIEVGDYYLTMPETGVLNTYLELRPYINNEEKLHNNQVWNIQYNPVWSDLTLDPARALYSFVSDTIVWEEDGRWHIDELGRMKDGNTEAVQSETNTNWDWREHRVYFNGIAYSIVNNHNNKALVFANETANERAQSLDAKKFNFKFRTIDDVVANPKEPNAIQSPVVSAKAKIFGAVHEIVVAEANRGDRIAIYDISGRLVKTAIANGSENRINIGSGLYIVRVSGQTPTASKVIVR